MTGRARGKKRWIAVAAVVLVAGGGTGAWAMTRSSGSATAAGVTTTVVTASTGTIQQTVSSTGTIEPTQDENLSFGVGGTVTRVKATVGLKVAKGTVLATLEPTSLQSAVDTASAAVTAAEEQVTAEASATTTQQAAAAAQLASAQTALSTAKANLADASLKAPFAGTVAAVTMAVGDVIGGSSSGPSSSSGGGSTTATSSDTITLISTDSWIVNASVGSADLAQLSKGLQVQITPSGSTTKVFGTVSSIGIVASSSTSGSATFPVVVAVTGSPTGLYSGASATLSFIVKTVDNVLTVPTQALSTTNGKTTVVKIVGGKKVVTDVTVGTSYGATTEITKGLVSGDQVQLSLVGPGGGTTRRSTTGGTGNTGGGFGGFGGPPGGTTGQGAP